MSIGIVFLFILLPLLVVAGFVIIFFMIGSSDDEEDDGTGPGKPIWPLMAVIFALMFIVFGGLILIGVFGAKTTQRFMW